MCKVPIVLCCPVTLGLIEFRWGNLNSTIKLLSPTVCQCVPVCQCVSVCQHVQAKFKWCLKMSVNRVVALLPQGLSS